MLRQVFALVCVGVAAGAGCTYQPNCDYARGSREHAAARSKEECCALCAGRPGCAAGVFDGASCWFKDIAQVKPGCQHSDRVQFACIEQSIKPPSPPIPPSPPPGPIPPSPACPPGGEPVQVFLLMGQSNMLGEGRVLGPAANGSLEFAVRTQHKYSYLWNGSANSWSVSRTVRNVGVMGSGGPTAPVTLHHNEFMTAGALDRKSTIGPELGIGFGLGNYTSSPVMTLKSCIGDRALGWDLLPPNSSSFDYTDTKNNTWTYAGYHQSPERWAKGSTPVPINWEAGLQYDGDTFRAGQVLANLTTYYPGQRCWQLMGIFWWQGDRDSRDMALAGRYETNLVKLIKSLRAQFDAPNAKFVTASLGQTVKGDSDGGGVILDAMEAVDGESGKYPEFKGNVATVYTHPLSMGSSSGAHYGGNAETYMNVGQAMGAAMVGLLKADQLVHVHSK